MQALLDSHGCDGDRGLISSAECLSSEVKAKPEICAALPPDVADQLFTLAADDGFADLPEKAPDSNREFGARDRRLAAAAHQHGGTHDVLVWLVSDDEDFLANLEELVEHLDVAPIHSCDLLYRLAACGALEWVALEELIAVENDRISTMVMGDFKKARKLERLNDLTSRLVASNWRQRE
ncbi:hypothetical protein ABZX12_13805 [Kribbella sp. NPDC003505]|uniref:hypothetical protein n=1 Tax=Kribbella sp. NPDC003505 TaxID=3154448 RepID=UPI0033BBE443